MKKIVFAIVLQVLGMAALNAQIKGFVTDEQGSAISNATVSLLKAKDSSVVKLELSKNGSFGFSQPAMDRFLIRISYVGHQTFFSQPFLYTGTSINLPACTLTAARTKMEGITITARKKVLDVKSDRTILNVEGTISSTGSDALELLRKSPGVSVDNDEKLSVNGKNGVQVYVDNKPVPLNSQDLSNYLKSIPSAQIEAIEIIHSPGAMYEAAGSAGIINIRLKKNKTMGFNGSVNAGISASRNRRWEDGFAINFRNPRLNAYASYTGNYGKLESSFELNRIVKDSAFNQRTNIRQYKNNHVFKTGLDYTLGNRSNIGVMVSGNINAPEVNNSNTTPVSYIPTGAVAKVLVAENRAKQQNSNINGNINYMYKDTAGRMLLVNADYGYYNNRQDQTQPNIFYDAAGKNELYRRNYQISSPTRIDIYSLKADYEQDFAKGRLSMGGKAGFVKTDNTFNQFIQSGSEWQSDKERSNFFRYRENVNAAYLTYSRDFKAIALQAGIRAEQTNVEGTLRSFKKNGADYTEETSGFKRDYLDFFPSVTVTIAPKSTNQVALAYNRRIDRPVYQDLNPFEYRINEYHYHKGSIDLRPQYTSTIRLTHTLSRKLNTTLSYSHVKDVFG
ncbi:MAG TPA: outer membrane beta-barrel protein, partial [Flavisolibacter sp.]|nr:outer membrane beta-barrel protein [Flavisolibacter sp.]